MFFFERFYVNLAKDKSLKYFFQVPKQSPKGESMEDVKAWLKAYDRAKLENDKIYKRSGYMGLYRRLLSSENYSAKKEKQVLNARSEDIMRIMSLENSTIV